MKLTVIDIKSDNPVENLQLENDIFKSNILSGAEQSDLIIRFGRNSNPYW